MLHLFFHLGVSYLLLESWKYTICVEKTYSTKAYTYSRVYTLFFYVSRSGKLDESQNSVDADFRNWDTVAILWFYWYCYEYTKNEPSVSDV